LTKCSKNHIDCITTQYRIVAKVDELMAVCDQLEANLTATQADSHRLLGAVLLDALAPSDGGGRLTGDACRAFAR
jgi:hypothetical protein